MKKIKLTLDDGRVFSVELQEVASDRAKYYAERDKDTTYDDELKFVMEDGYEGYDWLMNNMNWWNCQTLLEEVPLEPKSLSECDVEKWEMTP
jgi:hypothetical protein